MRYIQKSRGQLIDAIADQTFQILRLSGEIEFRREENCKPVSFYSPSRKTWSSDSKRSRTQSVSASCLGQDMRGSKQTGFNKKTPQASRSRGKDPGSCEPQQATLVCCASTIPRIRLAPSRRSSLAPLPSRCLFTLSLQPLSTILEYSNVSALQGFFPCELPCIAKQRQGSLYRQRRCPRLVSPGGTGFLSCASPGPLLLPVMISLDKAFYCEKK
jgi:hypothetical protein